jgi:hypothetical protein
MKRWTMFSLGVLILSLVPPSLAWGEIDSAGQFKWEIRKVAGKSEIPLGLGKIKYDLVWKEPYLLEGTAQHEFTPLFKPEGSCTWRFNEDFSQIHVAMEIPLGNPEYELIRVEGTNDYKGVWDTGLRGIFRVTLAIYPDKMVGTIGPLGFLLKITPPLLEGEVPTGLHFIFEEVRGD